ncbi:MAG: T9SS type A sorting domain-containing protein [Bacteroidota bacterium]
MFDIYSSWENSYSVISYDSISRQIYFIGDAQNPYLPNTDTLYYNNVITCTVDSSLKLKVKYRFSKLFYTFSSFIGFTFKIKESYFTVINIEDSSVRSSPNHIWMMQLYHLNQLGDTINSNIIQTPVNYFVPEALLNINDRIYIYGTEGPLTPLSNFSILCVDTIGSLIWYKKYTNKKCYIKNIITDNSDNIILSGQIRTGSTIQDTPFAYFAKMDTAGNFIWEKRLDMQSPYYNNNSCNLIKVSGEIYLSGYNDASTYPKAGTDTSYAFLIKVNSNGDVLNYKRYFTSSYLKKDLVINNIIYSGNSFYLTGIYATDEGWANYTQYLILIKLDLNGNLLWKRQFKQWYQSNYPWSIKNVNDGFVICGAGKDTTHLTGYQDAWLIKTDTNGCVVPGCNARDGIVQIINPEAFIKVYPNPASTELNIEITDERAKAKNFFMYDNIGNLVTHKNVNTELQNYVYPTSDIKNGLYYFVIELQDGSQAVKKVLIEK